MASNYKIYFYGDDYEDPYRRAARSIVDILIRPGMFMLETEVTSEDLEAEDPAVEKITEWLVTQHTGSWDLV